ncbi:MAG: LemA family protein [Cyclobacteriaceae bacterium]|nr:LemA family protein [Cyclobacteriaceae bacterium]
MTAVLIGFGVLAILAMLIYNNLVVARNQVEQAFGSIDVMLKKRYDLIPNLVETVKAYMKHEKETLVQVTELRNKVSENAPSEEKIEIDNKLTGLMRSLMVAVENYPDLKANDQFTGLQRSWNEAEEQISAARRAYNSSVTQYNNAIEKFPSSIFASLFNHTRKVIFEIPQAERQNVSAKDMFNN